MLFVLSLIARALARLLARSGDEGSKDIEILVLRHQLAEKLGPSAPFTRDCWSQSGAPPRSGTSGGYLAGKV